MVLWSTYYGENYRYLLEYGFSDDGTIHCRLGFTARNFYDQRDDLTDTHLHIGCWRFEPDFGCPDRVRVSTVRRYPTGLSGPTRHFIVEARPFNQGLKGEAREGHHRWRANDYSTLLLQSEVRVNSHGKNVGYNLVPIRSGSARNLLPESDDTVGVNMNAFHYDFWVTHTGARHFFFREVPTYAAGQRPLANKPLTVWHSAAALHVPRGEDFGDDGQSNQKGLALTGWAEFLLKPRDLFDSTPLYTP
jgi:Cu2+-containing amine oxidase